MLGANTKERKMEMALEKLVTQVSKLQRKEGGVDLSSLQYNMRPSIFIKSAFKLKLERSQKIGNFFEKNLYWFITFLKEFNQVKDLAPS